MKLIDRKVEAGGKELPGEAAQPRAATNVVDLVAVLQKSLKEAARTGAGPTTAAKTAARASGSSTRKKPPAKKRTHHKTAA